MLTDHEKNIIRVLIERMANMTFEPVDGLPDTDNPTGEIWDDPRDHRAWLFEQTASGGLLTRDKEFVRNALEETINGHVGVELEPQDKRHVNDIAKMSWSLRILHDDQKFIYNAMKAKIQHSHGDGHLEGEGVAILRYASDIYWKYESNQDVKDAILDLGWQEYSKFDPTITSPEEFEDLIRNPKVEPETSHEW